MLRLVFVCGPWPILQHINDPKLVAEKRATYLPMIDFIAWVARHQQNQGLYFIIEKCQTSKIWTLSIQCEHRLVVIVEAVAH